MALNIPEECLIDLCSALQALQPRQLLIVTPDDSVRNRLHDKLPDSELTFMAPDTVDADRNQLPLYDAVVLLGVIEQLDKSAAESLIGCLRDLHARHLFLLVPIGDQSAHQTSHWRQSDLLALGLSVYRTYHAEAGVLQWYRFELESYKSTPEWLNSKYWANPELFGKYRW